MNLKKAVSFFEIIAFTAVVIYTIASCENPAEPEKQKTTVTIAAIQGIAVPTVGGSPTSKIAENDQYTGTVTWSRSDATFSSVLAFEKGKQYTATITLTAKPGYTLEGVAAGFFTVAGAEWVSNKANSGVIYAMFPPITVAVINMAGIGGVTAPIIGGTPVSNIPEENPQYTGTVTWSPDDPTFTASTQYTATITLTAKTGYTLEGVKANFFTVAGATSVRNDANSGVVTAVFPAATKNVINKSAIQGIAPVTGETPVKAITENEQYTGTITWAGVLNTGSATFAANRQYTATITLSAKNGYTLQGITANFFTVEGAASVSNDANSGIITAVFPQTDTIINNVYIQGITAPAIGAVPVTAITETVQYTGTVTWSPAVQTTFADNTKYTAIVTLIPKTGYTLRFVPADFFRVEGAMSASNDANSGVVTAGFWPTDMIINNAAIQGVTAPVTGGTPAATVTNPSQYTGTVVWSPPVSDIFEYATVYTATITLTPEKYHTLQFVPANFFTVEGATSVTNSANSGIVKAVFPKTAIVSINKSAIQGLTVPVTGETPVYTITETPQYTGTVAWSPAVSGNFLAATQYTATITLTPKPGYTLSGVTSNFFTVAGATSVSNSANSGVITAVFPKTAATINIPAIQGVTAPATGVTPVYAITETSQYTGTIAWSPTVSLQTFYTNTQYTATITLTPKPGYTLSGVTSNFFTVAGATSVSNDANSGVIRAVFPVTATRINIAAIAGITAPATGGTPVTTVTETAQYTGTVTWNGNPSVFADRTVYTATITLTPKTGYTLQTVATDFFTVAGAITVRNSANSGIVTAVFPATIYSITSQKGIDMVWVPGGSFQMGGTYDDEKPVHTVTLSNFYMSKYEITQAQYQAIMGKNPSYFDGRAGRGPASGEVQENRPVEFVSLYDAMIFCNKLSRAEGLIPAYSVNGSDLQDIYEAPAASDSAWNNAVILSNSNGYRLPTEAQWEYAARGGKGTPWNYTYSGSNTVGDVAWYTSNSGGITHEVGKKAPNCLGLYDMSGNVWEWCWDWYGRSYSSEAQTDPAGPASGYERVIRGGAINSDAGGMHSVARFYRSPNDRWERYLGFRVVRPSE